MLQSSSILTPSTVPLSNQRVIVLFDLAATGHHSVYIKYLVQHWRQSQITGTLQVVVSPQFVQRHAEIVALSIQTDQSCIIFTPVSEEEYAAFDSQKSLIARSWSEWKLFCRYARSLQATEAVLMYLDSLQVPLCFGEKSPCPVSGIYFRPSFHYGKLLTQPRSWKERVRQWRQQFLLTKILRNPQLKALFTLDMFAIEPIKALQPQSPTQVLSLPDPVQVDAANLDALEQFKQELAIEPGRRVLLLFGELSGRKGVIKVLQALQQVAPEVAQKICLLMAGPITKEARSSIEAEIASLERSPIQLIIRDRYIKGQEVQQCFEVADIVLATYQRHVGMSSVLVHAAATQKPVIASNYGLMGAIVRQYELGTTINATDPTQIAQSLSQALTSSGAINLEKANQFLQQNLADRFVETIFSNLLV
ncbi:glycosyltransferase [Cyanobacteria bacterium FACHB-63]|nr:glycosyltransferase [Cyanobacteria bacterium FACHB-63]